jgi:type I restriction enzyme S subunit
MGEHCRVTTFGELVKQGILEIGDGYRAKLEELGGNGLPFLRAGMLTDQAISWNQAERFHDHIEPRVQAKLGFPGDTVVTTKGNSVGRTGYIPRDAPPFVYSPHLSYWRSHDQSQLSAGFLRYWSKSSEFLTQLRAMAHSTDMAPYLSLVDQYRLRISIPQGRSQNAISDILGALDDKITTNSSVASSGYDLAGALYMGTLGQARQPCPLGELIDLRYGKALPESVRSSGRVPVYGSGGVIGKHDRAVVECPGVIVGRKGTVGSVHWSQQPFFPIDTTYYVELRRPEIPMEFVYFMLRGLRLGEMNSDSAVPGLNRAAALSLPAKVPNRADLFRFSEGVRPIFALRDARYVENRALAQLRDTLLPGLMSGELRVREAAKVAKEAL